MKLKANNRVVDDAVAAIVAPIARLDRSQTSGALIISPDAPGGREFGGPPALLGQKVKNQGCRQKSTRRLYQGRARLTDAPASGRAAVVPRGARALLFAPRRGRRRPATLMKSRSG